MKRGITHLVLGFAAMSGLAFLFGRMDDAFVSTGIWYSDVLASFQYFFLWVIPYWWLNILIGGVLIGAVSLGLSTAFRKAIRRNKPD
jgi:hypothetical protein